MVSSRGVCASSFRQGLYRLFGRCRRIGFGFGVVGQFKIGTDGAQNGPPLPRPPFRRHVERRGQLSRAVVTDGRCRAGRGQRELPDGPDYGANRRETLGQRSGSSSMVRYRILGMATCSRLELRWPLLTYTATIWEQALLAKLGLAENSRWSQRRERTRRTCRALIPSFSAIL